MSVWSERVTGLLADDVLEAWEAAPDFVGSVRAMATVLTTDDSPPIGKLVKGSRAFVGSQLMAEAGKQAKKAVLQRALDKGAKEGAAKLLGGGAGTAVGLTYKLGKLALRPDECSKADVAKALSTSATSSLSLLSAK
jgi:hypothetical protein